MIAPTESTASIRSKERIVANLSGSITSIQAIYVPADDLTDPTPVAIFGHLDAVTVLSRLLAAKGIYPSVDPFGSINSTSSTGSPIQHLKHSLQCGSTSQGAFATMQGASRRDRYFGLIASMSFSWPTGLSRLASLARFCQL